MRLTKSVVTIFAVCLAAIPSWVEAANGNHEMRPGNRAVVRDSGISEPSFVPSRFHQSAAPLPRNSTFEVTYIDFTPEAEAAFQAAVDVLSAIFSSPVVIRVEATWGDLGDDDVVGSAGPNFIHRDFSGAPMPRVWYPDALADALAGSSLNGNAFDIVATFNSEFGSFYFGTDGNTPSSRIDFMSVVMHELMHGLGFIGSADVSGSSGSWGVQGLPTTFDLYPEDRDGTEMTDTNSYPNPSTTLGDLLTSNDLWWGGPLAAAVNQGNPPRLYAPSSWDSGSSYSHLNESTYPTGSANALMTPRISRGEAVHDPGPIALCMCEDMSWLTAENCGNATSSVVWVAAAARASGAGGSQWRTSLGILNPSASQATVDIAFHRSGGNTSTETLSVPADNQIMINDVVGFLGASGTGPIEVTGTTPLLVGSRTFNQSANGTFGQFLDGIDPADGAGTGEVVRLTLLQENDAFRTNIGFTNTGSTNAVVRVTLYDGDGDEVTTFSVAVSAESNRQENQPYLNRGGRSDIDAGYALVEVTSGSGVLIYGSVIDNLTGDPTTIPPK